MRRSTLLCVLFGSILAGLILGHYLMVAIWPLIITAATLLALRRPRLFQFGLLLFGLTLGLWRAEAYHHATQNLTALIDQKVTMTGTVTDDPGITTTGTAFKIATTTINGAPSNATISVYMQRENLHRGWHISATGKLKPGFGNQAVELSYPTITVTSMDQSLLEQFRQRFFVGMKTALPEPAASFGLGLLVGIRALIPKDLQIQLALVGLSHLVAVSGYNLTIIVQATERLLGRFGRNVTLAGAFWLIGLFVIAAGGGASIVRAAFVSVLGLLAAHYGRQFKPLVIILLAAAVTALYQPSYLTDYGWLLSFTAFFGIMVLAPAITARLSHEPGLVTKMLIETTCAQIMTLPLIAYGFGQLSLISPLANLVELPLVPAAMFLSLLAGLAGMIVPAFAGWIAWPADLLLRGMLWLVHSLAAVPGAGKTVTLNFAVMLGLYAVIGIMTILLVRRRHPRLPKTNLKLSSFISKMSS